MIKKLAEEICNIVKATIGFGYSKKRNKMAYYIVKEMYGFEEDDMREAFPGLYQLYKAEKEPEDPNWVNNETERVWEIIQKELDKFSNK